MSVILGAPLLLGDSIHLSILSLDSFWWTPEEASHWIVGSLLSQFTQKPEFHLVIRCFDGVTISCAALHAKEAASPSGVDAVCCVPVFTWFLVISSPVWLWLTGACVLMMLILVGSLFLSLITWVFFLYGICVIIHMHACIYGFKPLHACRVGTYNHIISNITFTSLASLTVFCPPTCTQSGMQD